jgi:hypothetical protein
MLPLFIDFILQLCLVTAARKLLIFALYPGLVDIQTEKKKKEVMF